MEKSLITEENLKKGTIKSKKVRFNVCDESNNKPSKDNEIDKYIKKIFECDVIDKYIKKIFECDVFIKGYDVDLKYIIKPCIFEKYLQKKIY